MDWTFQSSAMRAAESTFNRRGGLNNSAVYFGVGSFGTEDDAQQGLGACYKLTVAGVDRPLLLQSINTGSDVDGNQFDLQIGAGGAGAFNTCAGGSNSMYPGSTVAWGKQYGGVNNRADCQALPPYPQQQGPMKAANDSLVSFCEAGFDKGVRQEGGGNPSIQAVDRVKCPSELTDFTQFKRTDDPAAGVLLGSRIAAHECQAGQPGDSLAWCLTRMMDCRKPSGAQKDNVKDSIVEPGMKLVQPCTADGYTRIDVQCGCSDCYC